MAQHKRTILCVRQRITIFFFFIIVYQHHSMAGILVLDVEMGVVRIGLRAV